MEVAILFEVERSRAVAVELGNVSRLASLRIVNKDVGKQLHVT